MKIAVDLDGVVFDFEESWRQCAELVLRRSVVRQAPNYALRKAFGLTQLEHDKVWAAFHISQRWRRMEALPDAVQTLRMMQDLGHSLFFVTQLAVRDIELRHQIIQERKASLDRVGLQGELIAVESSKTLAISRIRPMFYADDRWPYCLEARFAQVPFIAHIQAGHDGDGMPVEGVESFPSLAEAVRVFSQSNGATPSILRKEKTDARIY